MQTHLRGASLQGLVRSRALAAPARRATGGRRSSVAVQANLFARLVRVVKSYAEQLVSAAEDPERILDTVVNEMQEDLIKMRQATAQVMASQKQMETKFKQAQATADDWLKRAELAVAKGEDDLAREALKRRKAYQEQAEGMNTQLEAQRTAVDQLMGNTRVLEGKLAEAKSKKDTLKARAASAKTSKQVQEMVGSLNTSSAVAAFEKMEEKVMAMEAQSEAVGQLVAGDGLESRFKELESGTVDDELAALKQGMLSAPKAPPAALPEGRPLRDAIDMELDDLRKKARG
ncbi:MAG: PspA/IM30 family-domain-containing protein [Monoraphidium minutum]|nr:MAG: PspA/IM30 family-domain-containing protein [Monoraphidium minutum]